MKGKLLVVCALMLFTLPVMAADEDLKALSARLTQVEKRQTRTEEKLKTVDDKLDAILAAVTAKPKVGATALAPTPTPIAGCPCGPDCQCGTLRQGLQHSVTPALRPQLAARAPVGHTHTCANGHTWDHTMDGGSHRCPVCGLTQTIQDSRPRAVISSGGPPLPYDWQSANAVAPQLMSPPQVQYSIGAGSGDGACANGSCQAQSRQGFQRPLASRPVLRGLGAVVGFFRR